MGYNQFGGREINQAKLDLLKKHTTAGNIIVADTSALLYRANPSGEEHLSFSKKIAVQTNEARFYRALRKCIEDKEIDLFITTEVMEELDQISKLGKEINRKVTGLSPAIDGLIDILTEKERIFSPEYIEYPFYTEALRLRDDTLLTFIREIVYNNPKVRTRKISRTDAGIAIALLYASQSEEIWRTSCSVNLTEWPIALKKDCSSTSSMGFPMLLRRADSNPNSPVWTLCSGTGGGFFSFHRFLISVFLSGESMS